MNPITNLSEILKTDEEFFLDDLETTGDASVLSQEDQVVGQLSVDVFQTATDVIVKAPVAGVNADDLDIMVTDELVTIRGERKEGEEVDDLRYHTRECFWGAFARTVNLPVIVIPDKAEATFKDGVLTIKAPKANQSKIRKLKVNAK